MKKLRRNTLLGGLSVLALVSVPDIAKAQDVAGAKEYSDKIVIADLRLPAEESIVVIATGNREKITRQGQAITVIGEEELERIQAADILPVLERAPGVTVSRNGPVGGFSAVRIRGSEAEQVLVLIDGVRVNDPSSPGGGFDFSNALAGNISKIELLRGPNSVVWGSQAVGGVIAITTGGQGDTINLRGEYGSFDTFNISGNVSRDIGPLSLGVSGGYYQTDGYSSFAGGTEADGFDQAYVNARANVEITDGLSAEMRGRYADGRTEIDGFPAPLFAFADTAEFQDTEQWSGYAGLAYLGDSFSLRGGYSISDIDRTNFNPAFGNNPSFFAKGRTERFELKGNWYITDQFAFAFGAESENSEFNTGATAETGIDSGYGLLSFSGGPLNLSAGLRVDDHEQFGSEVTLGANGSFDIVGEWRFRASYGEGFKAPTLFQLLSDFGNASLQSEKSQNYDIGIEHGLRQAGFYAALTLFQRDTRNQIDFVSCFGVVDPICTGRPFGTYDNVAKARARGFEAELGADVSARLRTSAAYSYIDTENRSEASPNFGNVLARRPKHALTLSADWNSSKTREGVNIGADMRLVGDSFDNAPNSVLLDGYALLTLRTSVPFGDMFELYGRIENLFDVDYQTVANFGTAGRAGTIGARVRF
ncbi:TonB-dependent receptor [Sphingorhabdus sp. Alg239-R122]|uniref:TonB-dependent receptor plug domain-containing protein n=1 Tax=Sphingorhabdus sp. Alg239-R122 TaxID=2305989 RepID=UPI0013DA0994|nr:TonB-dependent receptor [Sphingorhabdus sp. Alg239-R122]